MQFKYLKTKDKVFESWLNPVLSGNFNGSNSTILPPGSVTPLNNFIQSHINQQPCNDMIDKPFWLDNEDETIVRNGDILSIGSYFINGVPLSSWSANFGSQTGFAQKQMMNNWYYLDGITKQLFPNGIKAYLSKNDIVSYDISKLTIIKLIPHSNAIGLNIYIKFFLNDTEIWGKFENVGIDPNPKFICEEINQLDIESKIKITGKIWNIIINWFKPKTGIYKCLAKEVLIYSELGQLKKITENNIIEVIHSDDNKIKIKYDSITYYIKKPTYYWFNWYFQKA